MKIAKECFKHHKPWSGHWYLNNRFILLKYFEKLNDIVNNQIRLNISISAVTRMAVKYTVHNKKMQKILLSVVCYMRASII